MPSRNWRSSFLADKYGALMPGNEEEAAGLLDAYLVRANTRARLAKPEAGNDIHDGTGGN
jgi:hypothetical protein